MILFVIEKVIAIEGVETETIKHRLSLNLDFIPILCCVSMLFRIMCFTVCHFRMASHGRTIIMSIHQPRYSIYRLFDTLTLLANGRMVYHGPATNALDYFANIGNYGDISLNTFHFSSFFQFLLWIILIKRGKVIIKIATPPYRSGHLFLNIKRTYAWMRSVLQVTSVSRTTTQLTSFWMLSMETQPWPKCKPPEVTACLNHSNWIIMS